MYHNHKIMMYVEISTVLTIYIKVQCQAILLLYKFKQLNCTINIHLSLKTILKLKKIVLKIFKKTSVSVLSTKT